MNQTASDNERFTADDSLPPTLAKSKLHETFDLKRIITQDSSGMLLEAKKTIKGRRIAVSVISPDFSIVSKRLLAIDHPNIIKAHQIIKQADGSEVLVMDLPEGNPLSVLLAHGTIFSVEQAVALMLQLLSAFHAVHKRRESIRTVGSNNIFIAQEAKGRLRLRLANCGIGTSGLDLRDPNYLSPEQVMDSGSATQRSDIWSAGAIFYHLLFGRPLFQGKTSLEIAQKIMLEDPVIAPRGNTIPGALLEVLEKALKKDDNQRFRDVPEMVAALLPFRAAGTIDPKISKPTVNQISTATPPGPQTGRNDIESVSRKSEDRERVPFNEADWAEAPTVPPDDPTADPNGGEIRAACRNAPIEAPIASEADIPALNNTAIVTKPELRSIEDKSATKAEVPSAIQAAQQGAPESSQEHDENSDSAERTEDEKSNLETVVAANRDHPSVLDRTKIDDLAGPTKAISRKEAAKPVSAEVLKAALKSASNATEVPPQEVVSPQERKTGILGATRNIIVEQPALAVALTVFTLVSVTFTVFLVSVLKNPNYFNGPGMHRPTAPPREEDPAERGRPDNTVDKNHPERELETSVKKTIPETVVIDLLRVPAEAKVVVDGTPRKTPLHLEKSKSAVKLTIRAKGFKPFERLIVPDQNRKMVVKMEAR